MPTPLFSFRLQREKAAALREMATLYGSRNPSEFLREMVGAMCSNDLEQVKAFNTRLFQRMGEQLTLKLNATLDATAAPVPILAQTRAAKPKAKGKKRGRRVRP